MHKNCAVMIKKLCIWGIFLFCVMMNIKNLNAFQIKGNVLSQIHFYHYKVSGNLLNNFRQKKIFKNHNIKLSINFSELKNLIKIPNVQDKIKIQKKNFINVLNLKPKHDYVKEYQNTMDSKNNVDILDLNSLDDLNSKIYFISLLKIENITIVIKDLKNRILLLGKSSNQFLDLLGKVTFQDRYKIRKLFLLNSNNRENNLSMVKIKNKNTIESIRLNHNKKVFFALIDCYQKKQNDLHLLLRNFLINLSIEQNKKFYYQSMVIFI
jgi:hypothetical protein